jgi:hypothetical protein
MQLCGTAIVATDCAGWEKKICLRILMIHVCIEREKKNLVQFPIDSSYVALQLLLLLCWLEKKFYLYILMIKNGLIYKWIFKILEPFQF